MTYLDFFRSATGGKTPPTSGNAGWLVVICRWFRRRLRSQSVIIKALIVQVHFSDEHFPKLNLPITNLNTDKNKTNNNALDFETLKKAIGGSASAFRCRLKLDPAGGEGSKVFPPTYSDGPYATEMRVITVKQDGNSKTIREPTVLLDSVQSQANRMELTLLQGLRERKLQFPLIEVDFSECKDKDPVKTPFVFDRFPKDKLGEEAKEIVHRACQFARLPRPSEVACVQSQYALAGVPPSSVFKPAPPRPGKPKSCQVHLLLTFDQPVQGPVSIGAGRYCGYGFCAPLES